MTRRLLILLVGVAACDPDGAIGPASEPLSQAEPGIQLPFAAPQSDGMFPQIAWDTNAGLFLPDRPNVLPTTLVRFNLESGLKTPLETIDGGLQVLAGGNGSIFYTQSMSKSDVLSRVGGDDVALVTAVQFAVSRNGKWVVVRDKGWWVLEAGTGARRALPAIPDFRQPLAVDEAGTRVVFGTVGPLSEFDSHVTLADVGGDARTIAIPGERLLAVEFAGDHPLMLGFASSDTVGRSELRFLTRTDEESSTKVVGTIHVNGVHGFVGVCGAWSTAAGYGVGVVQVRYTGMPSARHEIVKLDTEARVIGSADLWAPTDCTLSPDGRWFVYGNATGYIGSGELYLKSVR